MGEAIAEAHQRSLQMISNPMGRSSGRHGHGSQVTSSVTGSYMGEQQDWDFRTYRDPFPAHRSPTWGKGLSGPQSRSEPPLPGTAVKQVYGENLGGADGMTHVEASKVIEPPLGISDGWDGRTYHGLQFCKTKAGNIHKPNPRSFTPSAHASRIGGAKRKERWGPKAKVAQLEHELQQHLDGLNPQELDELKHQLPRRLQRALDEQLRREANYHDAKLFADTPGAASSSAATARGGAGSEQEAGDGHSQPVDLAGKGIHQRETLVPPGGDSPPNKTVR